MPSVQPCCKVSLEQVPSEQVLGEHGHPDVQLWPAAVCWSMDYKVGSYSFNISRCLKMSQGVSRAHSKLQPSLHFFKDLCCLLCIWLVCQTIQVYEYRIRRIDMMHRTLILMIKTCKITLVCKLWWLPGTTCSVLFKRSDDSSSRCKKNAMSAGSVAIQKQPSSVDPAKGLRSPNWDLSNLFNMCFWINILPRVAEVWMFQTFCDLKIQVRPVHYRSRSDFSRLQHLI